MSKYILRYARTVILTTVVEAEDEDQALSKGADLEWQEKTGIESVTPKPGSKVEHITDDDSIWEVEEVYEASQ